ncbi:hypothetical protein PCC7424_5511 (plasmid) [Gloeothece citriformis PCC 7424]|uniref:Uncharacterized protein n=1 Tax=Gloeothece citriformis (strain PCC 7424) TaxID=65393 RepID=B7KMQ7_GLOC7|nr:hypothetical protein [Gloeothece citriformis]ACK74079.1 hypothetical protein PCC7424_5511 [Gloeothece citriformis PCC 7424]
MKFKQAVEESQKRKIKLEKIDGKTVLYGNYKTGYLATDLETNKTHRWAKLDDYILNVLELGRDIDGFARR